MEGCMFSQEKKNLKPATAWLNYDTRTEKFRHHHIELRFVPIDQERPESIADKIDQFYGSMSWKKEYGYYDTESTQFIKSKRLNK